MSVTLYWGAVGLTVVLLVAAILLVRRDYRAGERLAKTTVVVVWTSYLYHIGLTTWFSWSAPLLGRLPIAAPVGYILGGFMIGVGVTMVVQALVTFQTFERMSGLDTSQLILGRVRLMGGLVR